jgi:glucokinase
LAVCGAVRRRGRRRAVFGARPAARAGDPGARQVFEATGAELGRFLNPYVTRFGAEAVLVLGGLSGAYDLLERPLAAHLGVPAYPGALGPRAPLLGAADLLINS